LFMSETRDQWSSQVGATDHPTLPSALSAVLPTHIMVHQRGTLVAEIKRRGLRCVRRKIRAMNLTVGCDLGKRMDHSALVICERRRPSTDEAQMAPRDQWRTPWF
jgi:hypothetical protein